MSETRFTLVLISAFFQTKRSLPMRMKIKADFSVAVEASYPFFLMAGGVWSVKQWSIAMIGHQLNLSTAKSFPERVQILTIADCWLTISFSSKNSCPKDMHTSELDWSVGTERWQTDELKTKTWSKVVTIRWWVSGHFLQSPQADFLSVSFVYLSWVAMGGITGKMLLQRMPARLVLHFFWLILTIPDLFQDQKQVGWLSKLDRQLTLNLEWKILIKISSWQLSYITILSVHYNLSM